MSEWAYLEYVNADEKAMLIGYCLTNSIPYEVATTNDGYFTMRFWLSKVQRKDLQNYINIMFI